MGLDQTAPLRMSFDQDLHCLIKPVRLNTCLGLGCLHATCFFFSLLCISWNPILLSGCRVARVLLLLIFIVVVVYVVVVVVYVVVVYVVVVVVVVVSLMLFMLLLFLLFGLYKTTYFLSISRFHAKTSGNCRYQGNWQIY